MDKCQCSQCGATELEEEGENYLRCTHCRSLFKMQPPQSSNSGVIIKKGGNVILGENSHVVIKGSLHIEDGANVQVLGKLEIIEKGSNEDIQKAKSILKLKKENQE